MSTEYIDVAQDGAQFYIEGHLVANYQAEVVKDGDMNAAGRARRWFTLNYCQGHQSGPLWRVT